MSPMNNDSVIFSNEVIFQLQIFMSEIIRNGGYGKIMLDIADGKVKLVTIEKSVLIKREP